MPHTPEVPTVLPGRVIGLLQVYKTQLDQFSKPPMAPPTRPQGLVSDMDKCSHECSDSASTAENFRSSLKCWSVHWTTKCPVRFNSSPSQLSTAWAKPCFPFLSHHMVSQNFHVANLKSFSIASLNTFHTQVFASATTRSFELVHSDSMSPTSSGVKDKVSPQVKQYIILRPSGLTHY